MFLPGDSVRRGSLTCVTTAVAHTIINISPGDYVAVLFNRDDVSSLNVTLSWRTMAWPSQQPAAVRDLWLHSSIGTFTGNFTALVRPHAVVAVRLSQLPTSSN